MQVAGEGEEERRAPVQVVVDHGKADGGESACPSEGCSSSMTAAPS